MENLHTKLRSIVINTTFLLDITGKRNSLDLFSKKKNIEISDFKDKTLRIFMER